MTKKEKIELLKKAGIPTPSYVIDEEKLIRNLEILKRVEQESGAHILLAQKAFSNFKVYPLIAEYISGTTASGLFEARLGKEEMGKENHVYAPAYKSAHMKELVTICDHIIFNSTAQFEKHRECIEQYNENCVRKMSEKENSDGATRTKVSVGLRINPMFSTQSEHAIYDPCASGSRLGITREKLPKGYVKENQIEGLHFHTLCEQNAEDLVKTFQAFKQQFEEELWQVKWLNMGGGHHISREDYDIDALISLIRSIKDTYHIEVYLEPGEAIALNAGYFVTEVMDIVENGMEILILDASAACHMPDVLEMPYRPPLADSFELGEKAYNYRLSSVTCLAGDVIGDYSFEKKIEIGDRLVFEDMAIYSMVKNNTFNGIPLPDIWLYKADGSLSKIKAFTYEDFKGRLS